MKIISIIACILFVSIANCQVTENDKCIIYLKIVQELKIQIKKDYSQKELFVANQILVIEDFVKFINTINPILEDELIKRNINFENFTNKTDSFNFNCLTAIIKLKQEADYLSKREVYAKQQKGICYLSNIGYYNNFAFVAVIVQLSYSRRYSNFYLFQKDKNWNIIYSKEGCD